MAKILQSNSMSILKIQKFLGLNEDTDGNTTLKDGELGKMKNFRITQNGHLQIRPGTDVIIKIKEAWDSAGGENTFKVSSPIFNGCWYGNVGGTEHLIVSYGGGLWDIDVYENTVALIGYCLPYDTSFFGFGNKVYMLNGHEYKAWGGQSNTNFETVTGYIPIIQTATTPSGSGTLLESVNRLNGYRRVQFSPDGTATDFYLPEKLIDSVSKVEQVGETLTAGYTVDTTLGKVTFNSAPPVGTNTITITYKKGNGARSDVETNKYAELYNGSSDARVFLYGNGTNKTIYSGIDGDTGLASAEYFPDLCEISIGDSNTPITGLIRHYSRLMAFKSDSTWSIHYGNITLADGNVAAAFYCQTVNRQIGNKALGQVKLLENSPITIDNKNIYQWRSGSSYSSYISYTENNAKRISDRVRDSFKYSSENIKVFNLKNNCEYWFLSPNVSSINGSYAVILNYANNTWYVYEDLPFVSIFEIGREQYAIAKSGEIMKFSRQFRNDENTLVSVILSESLWDSSPLGGADGNFVFNRSPDGRSWQYNNEDVDLSDYGITLTGVYTNDNSLTISRKTVDDVVIYKTRFARTIDAYAETGAMDFQKDWLLKYSPVVFIAMQPENGARIHVTVESNKRSDYPEKLVAYNLMAFSNIDFNHFSFGTNRKPQVKKIKLKVKKATFYKLIFKSNSASSTATIIEADIKLRYAGEVK